MPMHIDTPRTCQHMQEAKPGLMRSAHTPYLAVHGCSRHTVNVQNTYAHIHTRRVRTAHTPLNRIHIRGSKLIVFSQKEFISKLLEGYCLDPATGPEDCRSEHAHKLHLKSCTTTLARRLPTQPSAAIAILAVSAVAHPETTVPNQAGATFCFLCRKAERTTSLRCTTYETAINMTKGYGK